MVSKSDWNAFSVLVVDDEVGMQTILKKALSKQFGQVHTVGTIEDAEAIRQSHHLDLIILDINLPGQTGLEWQESIACDSRNYDVIFMTGYAELDTAIQALRLGAADFILKPFNLENMLQAVKRCMDRRLVERTNFALQREVEKYNPIEMIGNAEKTMELKQMVAQLAPSNAAVLIEGESGTGKELVARGLHQLSHRNGPFVPLNCGAIAPDLLESELFGHVSGAFTGAKKGREGLFRVANNGTLFLDEIGEMPIGMQSSLLRALEQKAIRPVGSEKEIPVDVRIVAATNRNLVKEVEKGNFRKDLFYRLNVLTVSLPALRERKADLACLTEHFSHMIAKEMGLKPIHWAHEDIVAMAQYDWPGNIRELKNMIERCILLGKPPVEHWSSLQGDTPLHQSPNQEPILNQEATECTCMPEMDEYPDQWTLKEVEKKHIITVVELHDGNKSAAARQLGVARKTLERKFKEWSEDIA
ncbi:sigma-54 dependent transcriptional regulator [Aliivibrio sp. S3MY1]|uniref:sigma-54-dependent transcriptional regulator n=1 Tax=unclassified Aliivibrio TaxID=2645654 RepID=UPI0023781005|nr:MULTISPECIES: sigma-54 dependent transcriptional regulator [unclassified Aliivibrio]MDD9194626.1 sigma-54 dependent transcriptional regulator [Aliivibrio sp. S3MY1]MDD9198534.1 sigma-54 dependent transcriptional regulator [Aliivibrio sp. S2MY1]